MKSLEPFYVLTERDKERVLELYKKCVELELSNIMFETEFETGYRMYKRLEFYIDEMNGFWRLVVKSQSDPEDDALRLLDEYKISDRELKHMYSEKSGL